MALGHTWNSYSLAWWIHLLLIAWWLSHCHISLMCFWILSLTLIQSIVWLLFLLLSCLSFGLFTLFFLLFFSLLLLDYFLVLEHYLLVLLFFFHLSFSLLSFMAILILKQGIANFLCKKEINLIVLDKPCYGISAVVNSWELNEKRDKIHELSILGIIVPTYDRYCTLRLKHIRTGWVIKNHSIFHVPS